MLYFHDVTIESENSQLLLVFSNGVKSFHENTTLPVLASYTRELAHYSKVKLHRNTLLEMLELQENNLKDLNNLKIKGKGSLIEGIFNAISETVASVADTGSDIFHILTKGVETVTNDTVQVVSSVGNDIAGIFEAAGGPSGIVLYVIDILIIYLVYRHVQERQNAAPPLPPRNL